MIFVPLNEQLYEAIPSKAQPRVCKDTRGICAVDDQGQLVAACLFDSWTHNSCMIHIYIGNPFVLKHGFAEEVFNFVFSEQSGRELIIGCTPADNTKALKFIKHIGFEEVHRIKDGYKKGVDFVITEMRKEKCRWLTPPLEVAAHGQ